MWLLIRVRHVDSNVFSLFIWLNSLWHLWCFIIFISIWTTTYFRQSGSTHEWDVSLRTWWFDYSFREWIFETLLYCNCWVGPLLYIFWLCALNNCTTSRLISCLCLLFLISVIFNSHICFTYSHLTGSIIKWLYTITPSFDRCCLCLG